MARSARWTVSALAVFGGAKLLERVPVRWVRLVDAGALISLGIYSLLRAIGSPGQPAGRPLPAAAGSGRAGMRAWMIVP
jgi:hypothetical protein